LARSAFAHEGAILRLLFAPGSQSLVTTGDDRQVKLWDVMALSERLVLERQPDWAPAIALSPDGERLAVGRLDGSLMVYRTGTGERVGSALLGRSR
jgi:WD40 repeat protein